MKGPVTTLINPETEEEKEFAFDYSYWSHDGFETDDTGYNESVPGTSAYGTSAHGCRGGHGISSARAQGEQPRVPVYGLGGAAGCAAGAACWVGAAHPATQTDRQVRSTRARRPSTRTLG